MSFGDFGDGPAACRSCSSNFAGPLTRSSGKLPPLKSVRSSSKKCEPRPVLSPRNQSADKFSPTIHIDMDTSINHPKQSFFKNHHQSLRWTCFFSKNHQNYAYSLVINPMAEKFHQWTRSLSRKKHHFRKVPSISQHFSIRAPSFSHHFPMRSWE